MSNNRGPGLNPDIKAYPFQLDGARTLARSKNHILAYEMGLGKSLTTILAADTLDAINILVLCQSVGKTHWRNEFMRWQSAFRSVGLMHGYSQPAPPTNVVVCNYDIVSRSTSPAFKSLLTRSWDVLVLDEGQALQSLDSKRTKAVYGPGALRLKGLATRCERVWVLSGTPAPSHAGQLYPHLRALAPHTILNAQGHPMTEPQFIDSFCTWKDTIFGRHITGSKNIDQLRDRIGGFVTRLRKKDVLDDLPPLSVDTVVVHPEDAKIDPKILDQLKAADKAVLENLEFTAAVLEDADSGDEDQQRTALAMLSTLRTDAHLATQRRIAGIVKATIAVEMVSQELRDNPSRKIILFAWHHDAINILVEGLQGFGTVRVDGRDSDKDKDFAVRAFQSNQHVRVFVGQLQAAGTSITLTAASDVLLVEADWVPSTNLQAICRAHRIGQKDGVLARFLTLEGSVDRYLMNILARKTKQLAHLIDNQKPSNGGGATGDGTFPEIVET